MRLLCYSNYIDTPTGADDMTTARQTEIANRVQYILSLLARLQESEQDAVWVNEDGTPSMRAQTVGYYNAEINTLRSECAANGWADPAPRAK